MQIAIRRAKHVVLVATAALLLATGISAPAVHAAPKSDTQTASDATCKQWENWYSDELSQGWRAVLDGRWDLVVAAGKRATYWKNIAKAAGCEWAMTAVVPPQPAQPSVRGGALTPRPTTATLQVR